MGKKSKTLNVSFTVNRTVPGGTNESVLYSLILSSKLPKAREFKLWSNKVRCLPLFDTNGAYLTDDALGLIYIKNVRGFERF